MTKYYSNIDAILRKLSEVAQETRRDRGKYADVIQPALDATLGEMKVRIFGEGKDSFGRSLGRYVGPRLNIDKKELAKLVKRKRKEMVGNRVNFSPYEMKRLRGGRQIRYKDLEFFGDLRRSLEAGRTSYYRVAIFFRGERFALIARGQQEQISRIKGTPVVIWKLSEKELTSFRRTAIILLRQKVAEEFRNKGFKIR